MHKLLKVSEIIDLNKNVKSARFVSIHNHVSKETGEVSNYIINLNVNYDNLKKRDLSLLQELTLTGIEEIARMELVNSFEKNANAETASNYSKAQKEAYTHLTKNIKIHNETGEVFITGMLVKKQVVTTGTYKVVNSSEKTLAKKKLQKTLRSTKYRTFSTGIYV